MVLVAFAIPSPRLSGDEATKQRFLREYPAASQFLAERFRNVRCSFEVHYDTPADRLLKYEFRKSGTSEKLESFTRVTNKSKAIEYRHVIAMRDRPLFTIEFDREMQRFVDTKDKFPNLLSELTSYIRTSNTFRQAIISYYERITKYNWSMQSARQFEYECGQYVYAPWGFGPSQIERFMREPSFELIDANPDSSKPGIVEVRFRRMSEREMMELVVKFDTNNHWAVTSMTTVPVKHAKVHFRATVRYGPAIDGVAWPEVVELNLGPAARFTHWSFEPTPASEFRLSHYGLKDPLVDWDDPRVQTLAGLAMVFSTFAGFRFLRRWRRKKSAAAMPQTAEFIA
jgi:hypothetical protein